MKVLQFCVLMLSVAQSLCDDDGPAPVAGMVRKVGSVRGPDGSVAEVTKLTDVGCQLEQETIEEQDGSVSAVIKDFSQGKSVLLKSQDPSVCYVRDIPQDEIDLQEKNCVEGEMELPPDSPQKEREYTESGELAEDALSDELAEACKGRRLILLKEVEDADAESVNQAEKRQSGCRTVITQKCQNELVNCSNVCKRYGWWWGAKTCKEYKYQCNYAERCRDHHNTVCR